MGVGIFSDCIFFLKVNSLPLKDRTKLKSSITANGGEISFVLNQKCTHIIVCNPAAVNSSQQKKIDNYLISVVNPDFIWKSVQEERLIEPECQDNDKPFEITGDEAQVFQKEKKNLFLEKFLSVKKKDLTKGTLDEDVEFEDGEDLVNVDDIPDDTEVAKYCCFQKDKEYAIVELLCFNREEPFPFRISTVQELPNTSQKEFIFRQVDTAGKACEKYEFQCIDIKNKGFTEINRIPLQAENLASKALQKVLLGETSITELSPEVAGLVEILWVNAVGHLDSLLSCPVENISLNDVSKAEGILCQIRNALTNQYKKEDIHPMVQEFYQCIPHKEKIQSDITMKFLAVKQDLCQVIRDMVNVCETSLSRHNSNSNAKYQALRCRIDHVDPNSAEFHQVKQGILDNNHSNREFNILRVFRVGRLSEATNFMSDLGNIKSLLHASSPCNFVGILSRGLLLPKIIVEEFGGERTDIGNLGSGIYFSDSISTSVKYSWPGNVTGSRFLVVCDVALGKCTDVYHKNYTLTEPPDDFNSVHGVQNRDGVNSDFIDDEYVVYNVNQVQIRYIVQFSTDEDTVDLHVESLFISMDQTPEHCKRLPEPSEADISLEDLPYHQDTKAGLKGSDGQQIPLQSIHIKARLMDLVVKVVMFQTYKNNFTFPIEAKYVFPLDSTAAVCGFEAFINGKHIIGEIKEKQQAHREYRAAISEGHGAYLMDQDAPDVFTVSVGNLPPKATVVIKITYVMEQQYQYGYTHFNIPGNMAQWQQDKALKENTQDTVTKVGIESDMAAEGPFCLDMSIEMPRRIENIVCYTHNLKIKRTECKAVIQTEESSIFNENGISIDIYVEDADVPRMWVEKHPEEETEACMLVFKPDFESFDYNYSEDVYLTICLDCSNSMESCFYNAKQLALLALQYLSCNYVNFVLFGSDYKEYYSYPKPRHCGNSSIEQFIKEAKPNMGSTEFWKVLRSLYLLRPKTGSQKVVLISDGHVQNENLVFQILKENHIQLFTCGVGTPTNKHMLRCLAQYGSGAFEYFADSSKSEWRDQMSNQSRRLYSPICTAVSVKWRLFNHNHAEILQAPKTIQALFSNDWLLVYRFASDCTQATLKALIADKEFENIVSTTELQKTTGTILHTLTARALIKDYEHGILHEKENENEMKKQEMKSIIIELSKQYSLVTPFTSFVAVEKRTAEESTDIEPNVAEIISAENVDILPYMDWPSVDVIEESSFSDEAIEGTSEEGLSSGALHLEVVLDDAEEDQLNLVLQSTEISMPPPPPPHISDKADTLTTHFKESSLSDECLGFAYEDGDGNSSPEMPMAVSQSLQMGDPPMPALRSSMISLHSSKSAARISEPPRQYSSLVMEPPSAPFGLIPDGQSMAMAGAGTSLFGSAPFSDYSSSEGFSFAPKQSKVKSSDPLTAQSSLANYFFAKPRSIKSSFAPKTPLEVPGSGLFGSAQFSSPILGTCLRAVNSCRVESLQPPKTQPSSVMHSFSFTPLSLETDHFQMLMGAPEISFFGSAPFSSSSSLRDSFFARKQISTQKHLPVGLQANASLRRQFVPPSWSSLSLLQSEEGYWLLNLELGELLRIRVLYFTEDFLVKKGIKSLGTRGIDTIHKLIATLLVLQIIRTYNLLSEIKFKNLLKLDESIPKCLYPSIEKAIHWAVKSDQQYPGICIRLGLGKDWDQATRWLLGLDPISTTSDLFSASEILFLA